MAKKKIKMPLKRIAIIYFDISNLSPLRYFENRNIFDRFQIAVSHGTRRDGFADLNRAPHIFHNYCVKTDFFVCEKLLKASYKMFERNVSAVYNYYYARMLPLRCRRFLLQVPRERESIISVYFKLLSPKKIAKYVNSNLIIFSFLFYYKYITYQ